MFNKKLKERVIRLEERVKQLESQTVRRIRKLEEYLDITYVPENEVTKREPAHYKEGRDDIRMGWSSDWLQNVEDTMDAIRTAGNHKESKEYWSPKHNLDGCKHCGRNDVRHQGRGYCGRCYYKKVVSKKNN